MSAKGHHFITRAYLQQFAPQDTNTSRMVEIDLTRRQVRSNKLCKELATKRNFNRVEREGCDPNALETDLSRFEDKVIAAIRDLKQSKSLDQSTLVLLINLMALFHNRNPSRREENRNSIMSMLYGIIMNDKSIPDEVAEMVYNGSIKVDIHQNAIIMNELGNIGPTVRWLATKKWLLVSSEDNLTFITSDRPVSILNLPSVEMIIFPITKELCLVSLDRNSNETLMATEKFMASFNSMIAGSAAEYLYSTSEDCIFLKHTNEICYGASKFIEYLNELVPVSCT